MSNELERAEANLRSAEAELHKAEQEEAAAVQKIEAAVEEIKVAEEHREIHFTVDGEPHETDQRELTPMRSSVSLGSVIHPKLPRSNCRWSKGELPGQGPYPDQDARWDAVSNPLHWSDDGVRWFRLALHSRSSWTGCEGQAFSP